MLQMFGLDFMLQLYARNANMWILSILLCISTLSYTIHMCVAGTMHLEI